jgi:hypothetical protein
MNEEKQTTLYHEFDGPEGGRCVCCGYPRLDRRHRLAAEIYTEDRGTPRAWDSDDVGLLLDED